MLPVDSFTDYLLYERNYSKKTVDNYVTDINQLGGFIEQLLGEFEVLQVKAEHVRDWMMSLMSQGYSASTVNTKLSSLRTYFHFLLLNGQVKTNPLALLSGPKKKKPLPTFLKESEMNRLLDDVQYGDNFEGVRNRMILEMFYATGMRLSELIGLDDAHVDFFLHQIRVTGKRNKQRFIPFDAELEKSMMLYLEVRDLQIRENRESAFFVRKNGKRMYAGLVRNIVKKHVSLVSTLKKNSPHVLRHTFATQMLNHEADLEAVKELLGHESVATTQVYTHTTFEELKKAYKQSHPRG